MSNQMVRVARWWDNSASDVLTFLSESMGDVDGDIAVLGVSVHLVHFTLEASVDLDSEAVVALQVGVGVGYQVAVSSTAAGSRSATALSFAATAAHAALVRAGAVVGVVLALAASVFAL